MYLKQKIGKIGEDIACKYLKKNKYIIMDRNFRCRQGEIDIIAYDESVKELVFIEVKTRSSTKYGRPCEAVKRYKKNHIIDSAKYYNYKNKIADISIRFDVVEVFVYNSNYKVNHIKQAFSI